MGPRGLSGDPRGLSGGQSTNKPKTKGKKENGKHVNPACRIRFASLLLHPMKDIEKTQRKPYAYEMTAYPAAGVPVPIENRCENAPAIIALC